MYVQVWIYRDRVLKDILLLFIITSLVFSLGTLTTVSDHNYAEVWSKKTFQVKFEEMLERPLQELGKKLNITPIREGPSFILVWRTLISRKSGDLNSSSNLCKVLPLRSKYLEQEIANMNIFKLNYIKKILCPWYWKNWGIKPSFKILLMFG
jgi:hypothetical protein